MDARDILPTILATFGPPRREVIEGRDFEWSSTSWTHNAFRVYEKVFARRIGTRPEMSTIAWLDDDGEAQKFYVCHSWESLFAMVETYIRAIFAEWKFAPFKIVVPVFATPQGMTTPLSPYLFAIAFDAVDTNSTSTASPSTLSHTVTGSNPFLAVYTYGTLDFCSGATYNSVSMAKGADAAGNAQTNSISLFALGNPSTGAHTVSVTVASGNVRGFMAMSYSGAQSSSVFDAVTPQHLASTASGGNSFSHTTIANNCWVLFGMTSDAHSPSAGSGITARGTVFADSGTFDSNSAITPAGAFTVNFNMASSGADTWGITASIAPFVTPSGPANVKSWDGITQSTGIKTYEGLALASVKTVTGVA